MSRKVVVATLLLLAGCGGDKAETKKPGRAPGAAPAGRHSGEIVRLKLVRKIDEKVTGLEAFRLLVPEGWEFECDVPWSLSNTSSPATTVFAATAPGGQEKLQCFPSMAYFWTTNRMVLRDFPIGSRYLGREVRPPLEPTDVLRHIVLPRYRGDHSDLRIVEAEMLPDLARKLGPGQAMIQGADAELSGGRLKVEYTLDGRPTEEEFYCVVERDTSVTRTAYGTVADLDWFATHLLAFRAPRGQRARQVEKCWVMIHSFRANPLWFNKYTQLVRRLTGMRIRQVEYLGQLTEILKETTDEISDTTMQSWQQRGALYARIAQEFIPPNRRIIQFYDPAQQQRVQLPSGYATAWSNGLGDYILSDDPAFDPNLDSSQIWTALRR